MHTYGIYLGIQIELRKVTMAYGHQIKENQMPGYTEPNLNQERGSERHGKNKNIFCESKVNH